MLEVEEREKRGGDEGMTYILKGPGKNRVPMQELGLLTAPPGHFLGLLQPGGVAGRVVLVFS